MMIEEMIYETEQGLTAGRIPRELAAKINPLIGADSVDNTLSAVSYALDRLSEALTLQPSVEEQAAQSLYYPIQMAVAALNWEHQHILNERLTAQRRAKYTTV